MLTCNREDLILRFTNRNVFNAAMKIVHTLEAEVDTHLADFGHSDMLISCFETHALDMVISELAVHKITIDNSRP